VLEEQLVARAPEPGGQTAADIDAIPGGRDDLIRKIVRLSAQLSHDT